tara:strand:+ start:6813 stop:7649 length:837 start_codon:yes stop_codon:yes gene_type:complete
MTTVRELDASRSISVGEGKANLRKSYYFSGYNDEKSVIDTFGRTVVNDDSTTTFVPFIGSKHTDADPNGFSILICYRFDLNKQPGATDLWQVDFEYRSLQRPAASPGETTSVSTGPEAIGFEEQTARLTGNFDLMYRADTLPSDETTEDDIGGRSVDVGGQPTSVFRPKYEIQLAKTSTQQFSREIARYGEEVGTRNSRSVFGLKKGTLLYKGADITRITHGSYRVVHTWSYDSLFHVVQVPEYTADGQLPLNKEGRAKKVYQVQPFPLGSSHIFTQR